jgi:hypothetical protein
MNAISKPFIALLCLSQSVTIDGQLLDKCAYVRHFEMLKCVFICYSPAEYMKPSIRSRIFTFRTPPFDNFRRKDLFWSNSAASSSASASATVDVLLNFIRRTDGVRKIDILTTLVVVWVDTGLRSVQIPNGQDCHARQLWQNWAESETTMGSDARSNPQYEDVDTDI